MRFIRIIFAALIATVPAAVNAQTKSGEDLVQTELMADVVAIKPGQSFKLGLRFTIEPAWHIYWINPGDSGQAPEAKWTAPDGFKFSPLQFPVPKRFEQPGDLVGYGYERDTMLIVDVTAPGELKPDTTATITADVSWLVCEDVCLPGKRTVSIELPVSDESTPANSELFDKWTHRLPASESADVAKLDAPAVRPAPDSAQQFRVEWKQPPTELDWFPPPSQQVEFSRIDVRTEGKRTTVRFIARPYGRMRPDAGTIDSVLAYTVSGQRKGLVVPLKIVAPASDASAADSVNR